MPSVLFSLGLSNSFSSYYLLPSYVFSLQVILGFLILLVQERVPVYMCVSTRNIPYIYCAQCTQIIDGEH